MQAILLKEAATVVHTNPKPMLYIPVRMPDGYLRIGCCGTCGDGANNPRITLCTRTDCGLAHRHHRNAGAA